MYDMTDLEAQWKKYKAKQRKPLYIAGIFAITLSAIFLLLNQGDISWPNFKSYLPTFESTVSSNGVSYDKNQPHTVINAGLKHLEVDGNAPSHKIELALEPEETLVDIPILDLNGAEQKTKVHRSKNAKVNLEIVETSSISAYRDVEERFLKSKDIDDAFFLAKSYFNKGDYEKSGYWALETNKLDASHEESLLIFVESKVKLGNRSEGISILKRYIGKTNSNAARNLLAKIQSNQF